MIEFKPWPKIARFNREVIVTEKLDGTNAQVYVNDESTEVQAGSRTKWITPQDDNFGFARWVESNKTELLRLGPGAHFGEWWGKGIQRGYGLGEKRFSLFNVTRWADDRPTCCHVVPVLWKGLLEDFLDSHNDHTSPLDDVIAKLEHEGSVAAPGFMKPEGAIIFHVAAGFMFKKTLDKDDQPKGMS